MSEKLILKIAKQLYADIIEVPSKDYQDAMYNFYDNRQFVDFTLQQDHMAQRMFKSRYPNAQVKTLTNGNVYLKYIDTDDSIVILALLSKYGKLKREDAIDANEILNQMVEQLRSGKRIETSCNAQSLALLRRLKKLDNAIKINKVHDFGNIMGVGQWSHYIVQI